MNCSTRHWPCHRTTAGGISLPIAVSSSAGCPESVRACSRTSSEDLAAQTPIVEEGNVLRPGETGKYPQTVLRGCVEHVARRQRIGSYGIDGGVRHHGEITPDLRRFRKQMSILARRERAVRDSTHQKRLAVYA